MRRILLSKFVRPGAVRIASTVSGTGSNVRSGRRAFSYELPAGAVATFRLPGGAPHVTGRGARR